MSSWHSMGMKSPDRENRNYCLKRNHNNFILFISPHSQQTYHVSFTWLQVTPKCLSFEEVNVTKWKNDLANWIVSTKAVVV